MSSVAVVGVGCRLPEAECPKKFWELLSKGRCALSPVPADRWNAEELYASGKVASKLGGFLQQVSGFDPEAFGVPVPYALYLHLMRILTQIDVKCCHRSEKPS